MNYFSGHSQPSLLSGSLISFHCLQRNLADSDHFCCVSVWGGTRSAIMMGCRDSAKPLVLRTHSVGYTTLTVLLSAGITSLPGKMQADTQTLYGMHERDGFEWQMHLSWEGWPKAGGRSLWSSASCKTEQADKYMVFTDLLMIITCNCYMCKESLCKAWICRANPTVIVSTRTSRDMFLTFWRGKSYQKNVFLEGRKKRLI